MSHYFINDESINSNEQMFQVEILNKNFKFLTDNGVFSKNELDDATRLLIKTIAPIGFSGNILDVGCGYGGLGLPIATFVENSKIHMVDVNLRALELTKRNAKLNNITNVEIYESDCYEGVTTSFDHVISNPPIRAGKKVVHKILEESFNVLKAGGTLTIVIGKQHGAASAQKRMQEVFGNAEMIERKKGFWILQSVK